MGRLAGLDRRVGGRLCLPDLLGFRAHVLRLLLQGGLGPLDSDPVGSCCPSFSCVSRSLLDEEFLRVQLLRKLLLFEHVGNAVGQEPPLTGFAMKSAPAASPLAMASASSSRS